jgi:hypothetical protein
MRLVRVTLDVKWHDLAVSHGYDIEPFEGEHLRSDHPWLFWNVVRPTTGRHCAPVNLPPMFEVTRINRED